MRPLALFDLDDTLTDRREAFRAWAEEFAAAQGLDDRALTLLILADAQHSGPMDQFFATIRDTLDIAEPVDRLWAQYRRRMPELVSCRAADLDALRGLRRAGWRIGIVTNGMTDNQSAKIRNTGLSAVVDGWVISEEAGLRKPDLEIFRMAAARCGGSLGPGGWMVGDSLTLDVAGGRAAGLRTVWIQRRAQPSVKFTGPPPDVVADSVATATTILLSCNLT